ncbi:unnamed protein product [Larinioides sclopetarius]
MELIINE